LSKLYECIVHSGNELRREAIEADSLRDVRAILRGQGLFPLEIKEAKKPRRDLFAELKAQLATDKTERQALRENQKQTKKRKYYFEAVPVTGGEPIQGDIMAPDMKSARQMLRDQGLSVGLLEVKQFWHDFKPKDAKAMLQLGDEARAKASKRTAMQQFQDLFMRKKIPLKALSFYTQQLATMLDAGLSINQTLEILQEGITDPRLMMINKDVKQKIMEGVGLGEAYSTFDRYLPPIFIDLIAVGELSGNLEETLKRLSEYFEKELEIQAKIKSALSYPTILVILIVLIVIGMMLFIVPSFLDLFAEFNLTLPWTTKTLLATSAFVSTKWWTLPLFGGGGYVGWRWFSSTRFGSLVVDYFEFKVPLIGKLKYKVLIARLLHNLALILRCGVPIMVALDQVRQGVQNRNVALKLGEIRAGVSQGVRVATLFQASGLFPPFIIHLLVAGEESGSIDGLLAKGAKYMDSEVEQGVKAMTTAIEPILTVLVAGTVLFILGSLYMPLMGLMGSGSKVST
jgi:type IV pilus assembly protein PilC